MMLANVAIPTVVPHVLGAVVLLPLVAAVEALVIRRVLKERYGRAFAVAWGANWRSTVVGLPMGYFVALIGVVPLGLFSGWVPMRYRELFQTILFQTLATGGMVSNDHIPLAMAIGSVVILVPYFFVSVMIERRYVAKAAPGMEPGLVRCACWVMNGVTYGCLFAAAVWGVVVEVSRQ